eukprot:TRINITY_DN2663_c0_g1_i4.p1 TRINITY_DN2663_c0_g1~~TRINITY_DN2663_c0_g1_i4.p1  ORF type:complete len:142 (+),score=43.00 TRINITY_DN2663_c0_g1_i4:211-636(+)
MAPKKKPAAKRAAPTKRATAKKATPAKKTTSKKATPAKRSSKKATPARRVSAKRKDPESSSGSAWEKEALKSSGTRKRKASVLVESEEFHHGSIPAQGTKPLKKGKKETKKKAKTAKAPNVATELRQIIRAAQAALDKLDQ